MLFIDIIELHTLKLVGTMVNDILVGIRAAKNSLWCRDFLMCNSLNDSYFFITTFVTTFVILIVASPIVL